MSRLLLVTIGVLVALYAVAIFVPYAPVERQPGTRLSGTVAGPDDPRWREISGSNRIFVETRTWYLVRHSVTTTSWVADDVLYVPCGQCSSKRWPRNVLRDPRVRLQLGDVLYEKVAVRITDPEELRRLLGIELEEPLPDTWVFRMDAPIG